MQLLLGCGHSREKKLRSAGREAWDGLVTVDMNPGVQPDLVHDVARPLPFADNSAEEIHLYDVIEHLGPQGDFALLFAQFAEWWRVLQPGGTLFGICPRWDTIWAWGDPGHTRVISPATLTFLDQSAYAAECREGGTARTDYRFCWKADFQTIFCETISEAQFGFALRAIKPSRWSPA